MMVGNVTVIDTPGLGMDPRYLLYHDHMIHQYEISNDEMKYLPYFPIMI